MTGDVVDLHPDEGGHNAARRAEFADLTAFASDMADVATCRAEVVYWWMAVRFSRAMVEAVDAARADDATEDEIIVALSQAAGSALMYAACDGRSGDHVQLADRMAPVVHRAMRTAATLREDLERTVANGGAHGPQQQG